MFILGRDPMLSLAELASYFEKNKIGFKLKDYSEEVTIFSLQPFNPGDAIKKLGGIVKIGRILEGYFTYEGEKNKIKYAISQYGKNPRNLQKELKKIFKEQKVRAFYKKPKRGKSLMPNEVVKQKLVKEGVEFLVYEDYVAVTKAVFNPFEHEKRDEEMPCKDYLKTISIRLAKILINLSQAKNTLLDPFCGCGVILQEAILQDLNVIGVDIDAKSIESSKTNLKFIEKQYGAKAKYTLIEGNSQFLSNLIKEVDGVATEPYLGPYLKKLPTLEEANKTINELSALYTRTLREIKKILKGGKVVMIIPRFITDKNVRIVMDFNRVLQKTGFKVYNPLPKVVRLPILYLGGNKILREIWILELERKV